MFSIVVCNCPGKAEFSIWQTNASGLKLQIEIHILYTCGFGLEARYLCPFPIT